MHLRNVLPLAVVLLGGFSCATQDWNAQLRKRAAFDLSCEEAALTLTPLAQPNPYGPVTEQGVTGCGKRASYVLSGMGWVMNAVDNGSGPSVAPTTTR